MLSLADGAVNVTFISLAVGYARGTGVVVRNARGVVFVDCELGPNGGHGLTMPSSTCGRRCTHQPDCMCIVYPGVCYRGRRCTSNLTLA